MKIIKEIGNVVIGLVILVVSLVLGALIFYAFVMIPLPFIKGGYLTGLQENSLYYWDLVFKEGVLRAIIVVMIVAIVAFARLIGRTLLSEFINNDNLAAKIKRKSKKEKEKENELWCRRNLWP